MAEHGTASNLGEAKPFVAESELVGGNSAAERPKDWDSLSNSQKARDLKKHNKDLAASAYDQGAWATLKQFRNFDGVGYDFPDPSLVPANFIPQLMSKNKDRPLQHQISVDNISQLQGLRSTANVSARYSDDQKNAMIAEASRIGTEGGLAFDNNTTDSRTILSDGSYMLEDSPVRPMDGAAGGNGAEPISGFQPSDTRRPAADSQSNVGAKTDPNAFDVTNSPTVTQPVDHVQRRDAPSGGYTAEPTIRTQTSPNLGEAAANFISDQVQRHQARVAASKKRAEDAKNQELLNRIKALDAKQKKAIDDKTLKIEKSSDKVADFQRNSRTTSRFDGQARLIGGMGGLMKGLGEANIGKALLYGAVGGAALLAGLAVLSAIGPGVGVAALIKTGLAAIAGSAPTIGGISVATAVGRTIQKRDDIGYAINDGADARGKWEQKNLDDWKKGKIGRMQGSASKADTRIQSVEEERAALNNMLPEHLRTKSPKQLRDVVAGGSLTQQQPNDQPTGDLNVTSQKIEDARPTSAPPAAGVLKAKIYQGLLSQDNKIDIQDPNAVRAIVMEVLQENSMFQNNIERKVVQGPAGASVLTLPSHDTGKHIDDALADATIQKHMGTNGMNQQETMEAIMKSSFEVQASQFVDQQMSALVNNPSNGLSIKVAADAVQTSLEAMRDVNADADKQVAIFAVTAMEALHSKMKEHEVPQQSTDAISQPDNKAPEYEQLSTPVTLPETAGLEHSSVTNSLVMVGGRD